MSAVTSRTLLFFLYGTGMRVSEALRLRLSDIDMDHGVVTIRGTKFYGRIEEARVNQVLQHFDGTKLQVDFGHDETVLVELWQVIED